MELQSRSVSRLRADLVSDESSLAQLSNLLDECFSVPQGHRFFDDFPVWSERFGVFPLLRIGVFEGETLVSSTAVRLASVKTPVQGVSLSVALIGAVATDPRWRNLGLASRTVEMAVQWAKERGACLALLWSSEESLYRKLGFAQCGQQMRISLEDLTADSQPLTRMSIHEGWNPHLYQLIQKRQTGLFLSGKDRSWYEAHKNVRWVYVNSSEEPSAYVGIGRGIDLKGMIHEWGGDREGLSALFRFLHHEEGNNGTALSLLCSPILHAPKFVPTALVKKIEPLCWAKILDPSRLISSYYPSQFSDGTIQFRIMDGLWSLIVANQIMGPYTEQELAELILGSSLTLESERTGFFPLPFWMWGLDAA